MYNEMKDVLIRLRLHLKENHHNQLKMHLLAFSNERRQQQSRESQKKNIKETHKMLYIQTCDEADEDILPGAVQ